MKRWIADLKDGERVWIRVLISDVVRGMTNKGAPYLNFVIQDKTGYMDAKFWSIEAEALDTLKNGLIVDIKGDVINYKEQLQMRVLQAVVYHGDDVEIRDYLRSGALSKEELKAQVEHHLNAITDLQIQTVCEYILHQYGDDFYDFPAASKNHHDYVGGLATHVLGMMKLADAICVCYPMLNKDLLMAGCFLHDIGKLKELSGPIATEYTRMGRLLGHISIMQAELSRICAELQVEEETTLLLRHMVLSHHGVYEYGSPVLPMIPEAEVLYLIDNLDARMHTLEKALSKVNEGEFTQRIYAMDNRSFYKATNKDQGSQTHEEDLPDHDER